MLLTFAINHFKEFCLFIVIVGELKDQAVLANIDKLVDEGHFRSTFQLLSMVL